MRARLCVVAGSALVGILVPVTAVSAGGWAMSSLDPMAVPAAGEEVEVGFTIRQHGVTPVNPDDQGDDPVAVEVRSPSGDAAVFTARQEGPTGHYVAAVTFPEPGRAHWAIRQGWFGAHDLGAIDVAPPVGAAGERAAGAGAAPGSAAPGEHRWPPAARAGAALVGVAAAAVAIADAGRGRRRAVGVGAP